MFRTLWASPCEAPPVNCPPFPCLSGKAKGGCPMNIAMAARLRAKDAELYDMGYPYAAWVVCKDPLDLFPKCGLEYFRQEPTEERLRAIYGERLLHFTPAFPSRK